MRRLLMVAVSRLAVSGLAVSGLVLTAGTAAAEPRDYTAELTVVVGSFDPITFSGSGVGDSVAGGEASIPGGDLIIGFVSRLENPIAGLIPGFAICAPGFPSTQVFPIPVVAGSAGVVLDCDPLANGSLDAVVFDGMDEALGGLDATAYLTSNSNTPLVTIPLGIVGTGGVVNFVVLGTPSSLTANPWTTNFVTVTGQLLTDPAPITFEATGSDLRDGNGIGTLTLVTTALADLAGLGTTPTMSILEITFVPEPGGALVGVAALAGLAGLARRRAGSVA